MICELCSNRAKTVNTLLHYTGEEETSTPYQCKIGCEYGKDFNDERCYNFDGDLKKMNLKWGTK